MSYWEHNLNGDLVEKPFLPNETVVTKKGIMLDIGCGENPNPGFVTMDRRPLGHVDIVHDLEVFPWPLEDESCITVVAAHIVEHIKPWLTVDMFNEIWRIMKPGGRLAIATPYAGSSIFWQDPTHCNGFNEVTFQYFDPDCHFWGIYKPLPWRILPGYPVWQSDGVLEVILEKRHAEKVGILIEAEEPPPLGVAVTETIKHKEKVG